MLNWILPDYISDVLPMEARQIEDMRRRLLDLFSCYGYEQVEPPLVEYVESLITREDRALDLKTFKLVDELSGRQMGLRSDITPQVARIDAHILNRQGVARLCYAGSVLCTRPDGLMATRQPRQIGAELYGCADVAADVEIIELMIAGLKRVGVNNAQLEVGHIGLFNALADALPGWSAEQREAAFTALKQKDIPALRTLTEHAPTQIQQGLLALPTLYGGVEVLERAVLQLPALPGISKALTELRTLQDALVVRSISLRIDLAELPGSYYHTGLVFNAYAEGFANAVARGGRYDSVGEKFGRSRPATGFSLDVRALTQLPFPRQRTAIVAPAGNDPKLLQAIHALRESGEVVMVDLGLAAGEYSADRRLVEQNGEWKIVQI